MFFKDGGFTRIVQVGGTASTMGLHIVSASLVGLALGYFLDDYFGTKPWLIMIFFFWGSWPVSRWSGKISTDCSAAWKKNGNTVL